MGDMESYVEIGAAIKKREYATAMIARWQQKAADLDQLIQNLIEEHSKRNETVEA
jgi:hypothetical protein